MRIIIITKCWYFKDVDADQFLIHMKKILPVVAFRYDFLAFCLNEGRLQFCTARSSHDFPSDLHGWKSLRCRVVTWPSGAPAT
jgi:hypothetical protein